MLNFMRRHAKSTTIKILFWVIIAVFVLWGVGTFTTSDSLNAFQVNGETIDPRDVRRAAQQLERFYGQLYGEKMTPDLVKALDFKSRALDQLINTVLLKQEAVRLGFSVTNEKVDLAFVRVKASDLSGAIEPSEAEVAKYYEEHRDMFREPDRVAIEYV